MSRIVRRAEERRADGRRRHDRGSRHDLHRPRRRRSAPTRSSIPACRSRARRRSAPAAKSTAACASSTRRSATASTVLNHCVITDCDDRRRRVASARSRTCAPRRDVGARREGRQLRRAEEDRARRRLEGEAPRLSRRRDDRRERQHRRRHDHLQLRRRDASSQTVDRGRRVHRQRLAAHRAGDRRQGRLRRHAARPSARTCRPARSPSAPASSGTSRAGSERKKSRTRTFRSTNSGQGTQDRYVRDHRLHRTEGRRARS